MVVAKAIEVEEIVLRGWGCENPKTWRGVEQNGVKLPLGRLVKSRIWV